MFHYITLLYNTIKQYFNYNNNIINNDTKNYNIPFKTKEVDTDENFILFKNNDMELNKLMFALNNLPDKIHNMLFSDNKEICHEYFYITIKIKNKNIIDVQHNLDNTNNYLDDNNIRYIFIKVNTINTSQNIIQHVNCIIIDKIQKYILFFEPKFEFSYDINEFSKIIDELIVLDGYSKIFPQDIGYNYYDRLQSYDAFCQSYILFVFILITNNKSINTSDYSLMFNEIITYENLGYMLFNIYMLLKQSKYEICEQKLIWSFPTKKTQNICNIVHLFLNNYTHKQQSNNYNKSEFELEIEMDDDFVVVNIQNTQ